ncbi:class I adenylate-forming enzyme family protein [Streptomyces ochraceiscleroticus]|uniref:Class I adenylate-forming enzyme family protein n=1 Tax=Streptomyces ochraceiscleroticus TaxID=47761 RepID=A0ABW1MKU9_9ACTN|nr:AMP-binding protein [Streptomyces ochraceiscleroticus]
MHLPATHLSALPAFRAENDPHGLAVADDSVVLTNAEFQTAVERAASALASRQVAPGDAVAVMLPNSVRFIVALFASWHLGAVVTPLNPQATEREVEHQLRDSGAEIVVTTIEDAQKVPSDVAWTDLSLSTRTTAPPPAVPSSGDDLALLIYTSGTTGRPKGVMLDHANVAAMCSMTIDWFQMDADSHSLLVLPLFHVNGIVVGTLSPLLAGGRTTVGGRFDATTFFDRLATIRPTYFSAVPTIYARLADLAADIPTDTSSLRFVICGAAPASAELLKRFEGRFGVPVIEGYGLSEGTCATTANPLDGKRKPGTVGLPLPGQHLRILAADGTDAASGERGEVLVKGPNVMRGYLNLPDETSRTISDGWLHTGDIGRLDEDGYLVLVDRAKDMIIRGGENIYPKEIEEAVHELDEVLEAAVVGRPDRELGEVPVLCVVPARGAELSETRILDHLRLRLTRYKIPAAVHVLDSLPKNAIGKISKPALRDELTTHDGLKSGI